mmetsp:Transcript_2877/g.5293  ORF Transcript_2877/g.5293 Transcript_2877/m.5293 type:complete len:1235 (-) Transcript_2877:103-3807(-)
MLHLERPSHQSHPLPSSTRRPSSDTDDEGSDSSDCCFIPLKSCSRSSLHAVMERHGPLLPRRDTDPAVTDSTQLSASTGNSASRGQRQKKDKKKGGRLSRFTLRRGGPLFGFLKKKKPLSETKLRKKLRKAADRGDWDAVRKLINDHDFADILPDIPEASGVSKRGSFTPSVNVPEEPPPPAGASGSATTDRRPSYGERRSFTGGESAAAAAVIKAAAMVAALDEGSDSNNNGGGQDFKAGCSHPFNSGENILHDLCRYRSLPLDILESLLAALRHRRCCTNATDDAGRTPLHLAANAGVAPVLIDALIRADPTPASMGDKDQRSPLHLAMNRLLSQSATAQLPNNHPGRNTKSNKKNAHQEQPIESPEELFQQTLIIVKILKDAMLTYPGKIDFKDEDKSGYSPLDYAIDWDISREELIQTLLRRKEPVRRRSRSTSKGMRRNNSYDKLRRLRSGLSVHSIASRETDDRDFEVMERLERDEIEVRRERIEKMKSRRQKARINDALFDVFGIEARRVQSSEPDVAKDPTKLADAEPSTSDKGGEESCDDDDDDDEEHEVDIITQKLQRNAVNGPINPMKEHDRMLKENEDEANLNIGTLNGNNKNNSSNSVLYSHMVANAIDADFDPSQSHDEAYVETQLQDLLSRKGEELSRLGPGIATLPLDPSSNEFALEEELAQKELALQQVIEEARAASSLAASAKKIKEGHPLKLQESQREQSAILSRASKLQSEIDAIHLDDCGSVLLANLAFYEAFSLRDAEFMKDVWWASPSVVCIHPSHEALVGSNAVVNSFKTMFDNGMRGGSRSRGDSGGSAAAGTIGSVYMTPTNIRGLTVRGTSASLVCDEEVYAKGPASTLASGGGGNGALVNKLVTTNMFRKIGEKWKMTHRHASWHPETTAAKEAMKAEPGIVLYDESNDNKSSVGDGSRRRKDGMTLRRLNGEGTSKRPSSSGSSSSIPSSLDGLDANAALGIPQPKEEEPKKSSSSGDGGADGMIGKIINLSDLLGGSDDSSGEKGNDDEGKGIGDTLADLFGGSAESDDTSVSGSGTPEDPFVTRRVIRIGPEGIENLGKKAKNELGDGSDGTDDDEEDKEVVIDLRNKSEEERKAVLSQLVDNVLQDAGLQSPNGSDDVVEASSSALQPAPATEADKEKKLRQKCIATLRKLYDSGQLSSKQKRVLLTSIVTSSARGEVSMVEVAYELLCNDGDDVELDTTGMEDFTEQCRVFASMGEAEGKY